MTLVATFAAAQETGTLTIREAVAAALENNPSHKIAAANLQEAAAGVKLANSDFLPQIGFSETATVGDDPVYAFGTRLRQGRFTASDFQLGRLNYPDAIGNFSTNIGGRWNLFNSSASRLNLRRARLVRESSKQQMSRVDQELVFRVVKAYYSTLLSQRQLDVAEQALKTAKAVADATSSKVEAGTAPQSDALAAQVVLASRQQELIQSRGAVEVSRAELESVMGIRLSTGLRLTGSDESKVFSAAPLEDSEARALKQRTDLQAAGSQVNAQLAGVKAARAAFGPRLDVFGSWQADNVNLSSNGSSNWTAGVALRIDVFDRSRNSKLDLEKAALDRVHANQQMLTDAVRLEVRRAYFEQDSARQMVNVARDAVAQADEALRIVRDRYENGLLTVTELLRAEDASRAAHTSYLQAVYGRAIAYAALQLATGELDPQSPVVTQ